MIHGYFWLRRTAAREARIMRGGRWFIGRTAWDREELARANPEAEYFHCDEIMRPPFYDVRWADVQHRGQTVYSTSGAMPGKGAECLLEALALLRRRPGHGQTRLRIAGVAPGSEMGAVYRRKARDLGLEGAVEWLGRLDAARIAGELQAADVFAYPSHADNSPNAVVEAMLVGAPIVAADVGGIPSLVRRGEEGLLVPRGDAVALAAAIAGLLDDRAAAAGLGAAASATAERRNDPGRVADDMLTIYAEVRRRWAAS